MLINYHELSYNNLLNMNKPFRCLLKAIQKLLNETIAYRKYTNWLKFPSELQGKRIWITMWRKLYYMSYVCILYLDFEWKNRLRFIRIYFDTPTFDRITKDRSAKFVDKLSAIGGTMGLLTGFSIISGVEIIYFAVIIVKNICKNNKI